MMILATIIYITAKWWSKLDAETIIPFDIWIKIWDVVWHFSLHEEIIRWYDVALSLRWYCWKGYCTVEIEQEVCNHKIIVTSPAVSESLSFILCELKLNQNWHASWRLNNGTSFKLHFWI